MSESLNGNENSVGSLRSGQTSSLVEEFVTDRSSDATQIFDSGQPLNALQTYNSIPACSPLQESHGSSASMAVLGGSLAAENWNSLALGRIPQGIVDWSNLRILQDAPQTGEAQPLLPISKPDYLCSLTKETVERYRTLYFAHFHDRWPIIHSPSYEGNEEVPKLLLPSILMIGGWIDGTPSSRYWALKVHHNLVKRILPRLCQPDDIDTMTQPLPLVLYQCTLLNIILASYCGKREILAKGLVLRNLLATSTHEAGILTPGTIYLDDKPGFFLPLHLVKQQQRRRIAIDLFKIDTYFSVIKGQPLLIKPEELHFSIPETFAHWNADGLPIFEVRQRDEPKSRSQRSINMMFEEVTLGTIDFSENESMLEDIQMCLWAMQSQISQLSKQNPQQRNELSLNIQRESLKRQLESLKRGAAKLCTRISSWEVLEQADHSPVRHYYGIEDHDKPGWENIVCRRIHRFIFDTSILYHLMSLQVFTETQTLRMLAKDPAIPDNLRGFFGEVYSHPHSSRVSAARAWTQEPNSRRALWHASEILLSHNKLSMTSSLVDFIPDPISYIALASAALVIWTHCMYGQETCNPDSSVSIPVPHHVGMSIELTKLSEVMNGASYDERAKEAWIESGACFRASLENVQLCSCNVRILMGKLRAHIPRDWEVVEEIAPNILGDG
ncbi:hypothetical protein OCU04_002958 [Sclerotinia nivalis]|uniref:Xylanolytic transcriptional activator regulatory domain-containing protein n=1 Tax=Sclerotinia nivalis TaxID=352851 RepID=A0A9X0AY41_9HELO|nr:hypothetical protein OCU04_002958 [Sclerotinia nivalis]